MTLDQYKMEPNGSAGTMAIKYDTPHWLPAAPPVFATVGIAVRRFVRIWHHEANGNPHRGRPKTLLFW